MNLRFPVGHKQTYFAYVFIFLKFNSTYQSPSPDVIINSSPTSSLDHVRRNREDDLATTKAVEKSTASARDLLRIASQTDSGKSNKPPCQEQHSGKSSKPPCEVQPFHKWLMSTPQKSKEQASNESFMRH